MCAMASKSYDWDVRNIAKINPKMAIFRLFSIFSKTVNAIRTKFPVITYTCLQHLADFSAQCRLQTEGGRGLLCRRGRGRGDDSGGTAAARHVLHPQHAQLPPGHDYSLRCNSRLLVRHLPLPTTRHLSPVPSRLAKTLLNSVHSFEALHFLLTKIRGKSALDHVSHSSSPQAVGEGVLNKKQGSNVILSTSFALKFWTN